MKQITAILLCLSFLFLTASAQPDQSRQPGRQPIRVVYVNHVEVESVIDNIGPLVNGTTYTATPSRYAYTQGQIDWEIARTESVGAVISFHMSGAFAEMADLMGHKPVWSFRLDRGHTVGVHTHKFLRAGPRLWTYETNAAQPEINQHWQDNYDLAGSLVGTSNLWVGESHYFSQTMWTLLGYSLKTTEAMALLPADQHIVWLVERDQQGTVTYPHFPQIGQAGWHGPVGSQIYFDLRTPQLKKEFLMLLMEWLERERLGLEPQVWAWGWCNHGGHSTEFYAAEIEEMLNWLESEFIDRTSPRGNTIALFAGDHGLKDAYEDYEQAGGQPLPSPQTNVNDQFPYMAEALADAGVTVDLTGDLGLPGVRLFEMERDSADNPPAGDPPRL